MSLRDDTADVSTLIIMTVCRWGIVFLAGFLVAKALQ